jgi:hypothetical protein
MDGEHGGKYGRIPLGWETAPATGGSEIFQRPQSQGWRSIEGGNSGLKRGLCIQRIEPFRTVSCRHALEWRPKLGHQKPGNHRWQAERATHDPFALLFPRQVQALVSLDLEPRLWEMPTPVAGAWPLPISVKAPENERLLTNNPKVVKFMVRATWARHSCWGTNG